MLDGELRIASHTNLGGGLFRIQMNHILAQTSRKLPLALSLIVSAYYVYFGIATESKPS